MSSLLATVLQSEQTARQYSVNPKIRWSLDNSLILLARASARQVQVTLGDYVVNSASETLPAYTFGVREIRVHPYFKFTPQADR